MIRNVVVDMGNVLLTWEPGRFALQAAGNEQDAGILCQALFSSPLWPLHDAGQMEEEDVLAAALLNTPARLHGQLETLVRQWPDWMAPVPGADDFTRRVREAGLGLYLLSNAGKRFPDALRGRSFHPRLQGWVVSAHEKLVKPDPRIYACLCQRYHLLAQECFFVDDLMENVRGAQEAGMAAELFLGDYGAVESRLRSLGVALPA
ncbi:MAG: HAD family hydrolase [Christensenellales bacterium]